MSDYDLIIRGGTVVTDSDQFAADIGISGGRIAAIGTALQGGPVMEAAGLLVVGLHEIPGFATLSRFGCT